MLKARKGTKMSREREIENLKNEFEHYKIYLMQCLLNPKTHQGELEMVIRRVANILYKLRTVYNIRI